MHSLRNTCTQCLSMQISGSWCTVASHDWLPREKVYNTGFQPWVPRVLSRPKANRCESCVTLWIWGYKSWIYAWKCQEILKGTCFGVGDIFIVLQLLKALIDVTVSNAWWSLWADSTEAQTRDPIWNLYSELIYWIIFLHDPSYKTRT